MNINQARKLGQMPPDNTFLSLCTIGTIWEEQLLFCEQTETTDPTRIFMVFAIFRLQAVSSPCVGVDRITLKAMIDGVRDYHNPRPRRGPLSAVHLRLRSNILQSNTPNFVIAAIINNNNLRTFCELVNEVYYTMH